MMDTFLDFDITYNEAFFCQQAGEEEFLRDAVSVFGAACCGRRVLPRLMVSSYPTSGPSTKNVELENDSMQMWA
jgi:hypothetical protein